MNKDKLLADALASAPKQDAGAHLVVEEVSNGWIVTVGGPRVGHSGRRLVAETIQRLNDILDNIMAEEAARILKHFKGA